MDEKTAAVAQNNNPSLLNTGNAEDGTTATASPNITITSNDHLRGAKKYQAAIVEYSDFQCSYCQKFHSTMKQVMANYGTRVAWVYRHYPLSFHTNAQAAAEAAECASEQGKFWEYSDKIFEKAQGDGTGLAKTDLEGYAKNLGLDVAKFNACVSGNKYASRVSADLSSGGAAGVDGTPTSIIIDKNGAQRLVSGALPYEQIKSLIENALK
jgi:protein-disulfide isomerase